MLSSFEINFFLGFSPFPFLSRETSAKEKQPKSDGFPIVSGSHSFGISVHQNFTVKEFKELLMPTAS